MTEDKMIGSHHQLNKHEFEQTLGDGEGQGGLGCCSPWDCKESDTTEQHSFSNSFPILVIEQSPLCYTVDSCWLSILNIAVYTC